MLETLIKKQKSKLEVLDIHNINKDKLKEYKMIQEWNTPYFKLSKKFHIKTNKKILKFGKTLYADLAVINYSKVCCTDKTACQNVRFYKI